MDLRTQEIAWATELRIEAHDIIDQHWLNPKPTNIPIIVHRGTQRWRLSEPILLIEVKSARVTPTHIR
jgi:hypothetical protein